MKTKNVITEQELQGMHYTERRITAYAAAKKNKPGVFPRKHRSDSKRYLAFCSLVEKGYIIILKADSQRIWFKLHPKFKDQASYKFYAAIGEYISPQRLRSIRLSETAERSLIPAIAA